MDVTTIAAVVLAAALGLVAPDGDRAGAGLAKAPRAAVAKLADELLPATLGRRDIRRLAGILATATDRGRLTAAASQLAASGQGEAVATLARFLVDARFLRRLDKVGEPDLKLANFTQILTTLAAHPSPASEALGLAMLADPDVQADPDRNNAILAMLASVRPMSEPVERAFRQTNTVGYWHSNGLLLVANGSPRALALFAEMAADARVPQEDRVDMIRWAVPPQGHVLAVVECVAALLDRRLPAEVDQALFATLFDFAGDAWFGKARQPPEPQPWARVEAPVLRRYLALGRELVQKRAPLAPAMSAAIARTTQAIQAELSARQATP